MAIKHDAARSAALDILNSVLLRGAWSNLALKNALERGRFGETDKRFITRIVYGTLEMLWTIDKILDSRIDGRTMPVLRNILRMGVYQALYMNVPDMAACNETVNLAKESNFEHAAGMVNRIMRDICREKGTLSVPPSMENDPVGHMSYRFSWPEWIVKSWVDAWGAERTYAFLSAPEAGGYCVRPNRLRITDDEWAAFKKEYPGREGRFIKDAYHIDGGELYSTKWFRQGKISIQGEESMIAAAAVRPMPGMRILDACAAPGGKAAYMAELSGDRASITAWDIHPHRVGLIRSAMERSGISGVAAARQDASVPAPSFEGRFDAVLIDAPCSGLGDMHGKPEIKTKLTPENISELAALQYAILSACCSYVRPGGTLIYSTCTLTEQENGDITAKFLREHPEFEPDASRLPEGIDPARIINGGITLTPDADGVDGFYICCMRRAK